jgi:hypothetical protein
MNMGRKTAENLWQAIHWKSSGFSQNRARPGLGLFDLVSFPGKTAKNRPAAGFRLDLARRSPCYCWPIMRFSSHCCGGDPGPGFEGRALDSQAEQMQFQ